MKYYTTGFIFLFLSFISILILLYFGALSRQYEKEIDIVKSNINQLNANIRINELEYTAHTNLNYLIKLDQIYLKNNFNKNIEFKIINIKDFENRSITRVFKVNGN